MDTNNINKSNKEYHDPMHTAEHILNQTMIRMFGCARSRNSHIERKKSKCDYFIKEEPTAQKIMEIEKQVNDIIQMNLPITISFVTRDEAPDEVDLSKLPENASSTLRIVKVGDYDTCACIGSHVENTSEIGHFKILNTDYSEGRLRIRFKLEDTHQ